ncbi:short-chain dehydrogenase/reductase [Hyaloscypha variabilis F]|uniref:Short-chain dehydrogenase/reductase n=1 Tax=Hyaloscypha variabilis (strain UAMH 11265 / GT02V1 / F) TaxID=1149755 RepID=A0A2J6R131_HYAVF|nr:short-chain dehydrogenase/reductase [Hyaloscypha variabilis F]
MSPPLKTVLITGCSANGLGSALAHAFHTANYHIFASLRTPSKISPTLASLPHITVLPLDILSPTSIASAVSLVSAHTGGKLDVLVNNAGGAIIAPALDTNIEAGKELFDLNFWAALSMVQAFAPLLVEVKGCVVNNASVSGVLPMAFQSLYCASKAALILAGETLRLELAPLGVRTLTLMTSGTKSSFWVDFKPTPIPESSYYYGIRDYIAGLGDGRMQNDAMSAEEWAGLVVGAVTKGRTGKYWPGSMAWSVGVMVRLLPQGIIDMLLKRVVEVPGSVAEDLKKRTANIGEPAEPAK